MLYQDALEIVKATRQHTAYLEVQSDTPVEMQISKKDLLPVSETLDASIPQVLPLENKTIYSLSGSGISIRLWQAGDTFPDADRLVGDDIQIDNQTGYAEVTVDFLPEIWVKAPFIRLHSTLAFYERKRGKKKGPYNIAATYERFKDHPYLGPVVKSEAFGKDMEEAPVLDELLAGIEENVAHRKARQIPTGLDLLRRDSVISTENLLSIINVQKEYQVPAIDNEEALVGTAEDVKTAQLSAGAADFTSTLIAGLSDFVVERAQDEFNVSFMNRFQAKLKSVPELAVLFPQSDEFLKDIDVTNYKSVLVSAREAFNTDVKNLGLNFPGLFKLARYKDLQNDPVIYNLITVYRMMDLVYRGIPVDTLLPLTFNQLVQRGKELDKEINLALGDSLLRYEREELTALAGEMETLEEDLKSIWLDVSKVENRFLFGLASELGGMEPAQKQQLAKVFYEADEKLDPIRIELSNSLDTLQVIPSNLRGTYNYDYLIAIADLDVFDQYFDRPPDSLELIGAGLELTRQQVKGIDGKPNKAELLMAYVLTLKEADERFRSFIHEMKRDTMDELVAENEALYDRREALIQVIDSDIDFWEEKGAPQHETQALAFIQNAIRPGKEFQALYDQGQQPSGLADELQSIRRLLARAEPLLETQLSTLKTKYPEAGKSPLEDFLYPEEEPAPAAKPTIFDTLQSRAFDLLVQSGAIAGKLDELDAKYCSRLLNARSNAQTFGDILELSSYLVNAFRVDGDPGLGQEGKKWMNSREFNAVMGDHYQRKVFLGLLHENLSEVQIFNNFSNEGVANLVSGFVNTLGEIRIQSDTLKMLSAKNERPRLRDYFPLIEATVSMVNQVLETPLVVRQDLSGNKFSAPLTEVYAGALRDIPDVSREILGLFENVSYEHYRYAIGNAVNLFDLLSQRSLDACQDESRNLTAEERKACKARVQTIQNIVKYGNFISDIAMAQRPDDVKQALLNVDVAGKSSQTKREDRLNLSLNGYFGGAFAREYPNAADAQDFTVGSLSVPIGVTLSFKLSEKDKGSFSFFLPVIDIGAVTAFRIEDGGTRYPELTLSNFIAPGAFLYRNMKNSPFYFGLGYQYGPNVREITVNGNLEKVNSSRFVFFNFGIDVPFFSLARVRE